mgnify:CR=1 FL=1
MASALTEKLSRLVKHISGQARITESNVADMLREVRMALLEADGDLRRIAQPVSPHLEMTALCDRVLRAGGPALLFEKPGSV